MIIPVCKKCKYLDNKPTAFRKSPCIPIAHRTMCCSNEKNAIKDNVSGEYYKPFCEEVNRHGECLQYYPSELTEVSEMTFDAGLNELYICAKNPFIIAFDKSEISKNTQPIGIYNEKTELYEDIIKINHSCTVFAACILDNVLSDVKSINIEIADIPTILFDKTTNTVTIKSYNKVYYTLDGKDVTENSLVYTEPFVIDKNSTIKAKSYANEDFSKQVQEYCVSIESPVINFDVDTNTVSISADDTILYSIDDSDIYDDALVYDEPFTIEKNTTIKARCIVDNELSEQVELLCCIPNKPVITYDEITHLVKMEAENAIKYSLDGEDVKKKDTIYTEPFKIEKTCTVKAVSVVGNKQSEQAELKCLVVDKPVITFDADTNTVTITAKDKILYSTDGSNIYDDADEYSTPFVIDKNTTVTARCSVDGILSEQVSLLCKVPTIPIITFDEKSKLVTIKSENTVLYTTDGSDVKKKDTEYKNSFKINVSTTIKARSIVDGKLSEQAELECTI